MNLAKFCVASVLALSLVSCASGMSKKDCEEADLYQMGLQDGKDGKTAARLDQMKASCTGQGVNLAANRYDYGRKVGLAGYCSESRAKSDVKDGKTDSICMKESVPPYQTAYNKAVASTRADKEKELKKIQDQQNQLNQQQAKVQGDLRTMPATSSSR